MDLFQQTEENTRKPKETAFTLTSPPGPNTDNFETFFPDPIIAPSGRGLEIALIGLRTSYSWANINAANNKFVYSIDIGRTWHTLILPEGAYELESIESEIHRQLEDKQDWITIKPNLATLKAIIDINNEDFVLDIGNSSLRTVLGWPANHVHLSKGRYEAPQIVNITNVNEVLIHCDAVDGSYINGKKGYVLSSFYPDVAPGYKIDFTPRHLVYLPVIGGQIQRIRCWITDQDNRPIKMRGELLTVSCIIRDCRLIK